MRAEVAGTVAIALVLAAGLMGAAVILGHGGGVAGQLAALAALSWLALHGLVAAALPAIVRAPVRADRDEALAMTAVAVGLGLAWPFARFVAEDAVVALAVLLVQLDVSIVAAWRAGRIDGRAGKAMRIFAASIGFTTLIEGAFAVMNLPPRLTAVVPAVPTGPEPGWIRMGDVFYHLVPFAVAAVGVVLVLGLFNMARGGSANMSQKLMRLRVILQAVAILVIMTAIWFMGR